MSDAVRLELESLLAAKLGPEDRDRAVGLIAEYGLAAAQAAHDQHREDGRRHTHVLICRHTLGKLQELIEANRGLDAAEAALDDWLPDSPETVRQLQHARDGADLDADRALMALVEACRLDPTVAGEPEARTVAAAIASDGRSF